MEYPSQVYVYSRSGDDICRVQTEQQQPSSLSDRACLLSQAKPALIGGDQTPLGPLLPLNRDLGPLPRPAPAWNIRTLGPNH